MIGYTLFIILMYIVLNMIRYNHSELWKKDRESKWFRYKVQQVTMANYEDNHYIIYRYLLLFPFMKFPIRGADDLEFLIRIKKDMEERDKKHKKVKRTWLKESQIVAKVL